MHAPTDLDLNVSRKFACAVSELSQAEFAQALDGIFEHSPWIAERTWQRRPFADAVTLSEALAQTLMAASQAEQLALIKAHPELAGKAAIAGELTAESAGEQAGARLDACTPEEFARLHALNAAYRERFGFPFILAVRGLDRKTIIERFAQRVACEPAEEFAEALRQIVRIASLRLVARIEAESSAPHSTHSSAHQ